MRNRTFYDMPSGIVFLVFLAVGLLQGCGDKVKPGTAEVKRPEVRDVRVIAVTAMAVDDYYETTGTVRARTISAIASRTTGTVTDIHVREGDRVRKGQVLATIDDRDMIERVTAAEAGHREAQKALETAQQNRNLAEATYERYKKLYDGKALTHQELDEIETRRKIAALEYERALEGVHRMKAQLAEARVHLGHARVTSPLDGVVTEKRIDRGSMALPGAGLLTVEDPSSYLLEARVDERFSGKLRKGVPVRIAIDAINAHMTGRIDEVVPAVDPLSRSFLVKIDVKGAALKSGLYARVFIPDGRRDAVVVPEGAVVERGQLTGVYAVDEKGIVSYRLIRKGKAREGMTEVLSGLNPGEKIIAGGVEKAVDGGIVKQ